jgi:WD40 repeat protein
MSYAVNMPLKGSLFCFFLLIVTLVGLGQEPRLVLPVGHTGMINRAVFSPDGNFIVTVSKDNTGIIWDRRSGKIVNSLIGHDKEVLDVSFGPAGSEIITRSKDSTTKIWDAWSGKQLLSIKHETLVDFSLFSPCGNVIILAQKNGFIQLWHKIEGKFICDVEIFHLGINSVDFSKDSKSFITASVDGSMKKWNHSNGDLLLTFNGHETSIFSAKFSFDDKLIVSASQDSTSKVWDAQSGKLICWLKGHIDWIKTAEFSPNNDQIITSSFDGTLKVWDSNTGKLFKTLEGIGNPLISKYSPDGNSALSEDMHGSLSIWNTSTWERKVVIGQDRLISAIFSPDSKSLLTISDSTNLNVWNIESGYVENVLQGASKMIEFLRFSANGMKVFYVFEDTIASIYDINSGKIDFELKWDHNKIVFVEKSINGDFIATASKGGTTCVWDVKNGRLTQFLVGNSKKYIDLTDLAKITSLKFSHDSKFIITSSRDKTVKLWSIESGILIRKFIGHTGAINSVDLSLDSRLIVTASQDRTAKVWDIESGLLLFNFTHLMDVKTACFSPSGSTVLTASIDGFIKIWDSQTGMLIHSIKAHSRKLTFATFNPNGESFFSSSINGTVKIWDIQSGNLISTLEHDNSFVTSVQYNKNGSVILTTTNDNLAIIWDAKNGEILKYLNGHSNGVSSGSFSPNGKHIFTIGNDHRTILWHTATGDQIYTRIQLKDNNHIITIPNSKYYMCSKDASKMMHYVTDDLKVIGFEQLDPVYNRPDKVLEHISKYMEDVDQGMIDNYRKAWEKRAERLGLDMEKLGTGALEVPEAEIVNADDLAYYNTTGTIQVHLKATDKQHQLLRYNVIVNEVPLFGSVGVNLSNRNVKDFDTTITVPLSVGQNKIQVSTMNALGLENFKYPTYINYTPEIPIDSKTIFVGIAVDSFIQSNYNLTYCVKDVRDLSQVMKSNANNTELILLTNSAVNRDNVLALKRRLLATSVNDRVIISCSSHGVLDDENQFYLAMHDMDFQNPIARGLAFSELEGLLDSIPARKKIILLDACNSGLNDETKLLTKDLKSSDRNDLTTRGAGVERIDAKKENDDFQTMLELYVNVENLSGVTVISAAGGSEAALEGIRIDDKKIENGIFTYAILEYIQQNTQKNLSVNSLKKYVENRVEELTNGLQKPTSRQETMEVDWDVFGKE